MKKLNSNMGCMETTPLVSFPTNIIVLNSNMGCMETEDISTLEGTDLVEQ